MAAKTFLPDRIRIEIADAEGAVALVTIDTPAGRGRLIGELRFEPGILYVDKAHVEGLSPGVLGRRGINAILRKLLVEADVERIIIQGARRTTGRYIGQILGAVVFPRRAALETDG